MLPIAGDLVLMAPQYAGTARELAQGRAHVALGAAVLAELGLAGRVRLQADEKGGPPRIEVGGGPDGLNPVLGERLVRIEPGTALTSRLLGVLAWQLPQQLCAQMAHLGLVTTDDRAGRRALACLPLDTPYRSEVVDRLEKVILNGPYDDPEPAALAGLLGILDEIHHVVRLPGLPPKEVRRRGLMLSRGRPEDPASYVVHGACVAMATGTFTG